MKKSKKIKQLKKQIYLLEEENHELRSAVEILPSRGDILDKAKMVRSIAREHMLVNTPDIAEQAFITAAFYGRGLI